MKHFLKNIAIVASLGLCSVSCNNEMPMNDLDTEINGTQSKISDMIRDVHGVIHSGTRADNDSYTIKSIETKVYQIPDSLLEGEIEGETRSISDQTYAIHTVTLNFGDREGFTILSDTPGIDEVFYYTESGCLLDTANNVALKTMIDGAPLLALDILLNENTNQPLTRSNIDIGPIVPFQWHQLYPFNYYATYCECSTCSTYKYRNHRPIGCTNIAVGQLIATVKKFTGTFYGNREIDFDSLTIDGKSLTNAQLIQLAHFLGEIALNCQTRFRCDGSTANPEAAAKYLRDLGYFVDHKYGSLDTERFIKYLSLGVPHIVAGSNGKKGHAWILDGIKENNGSYLYHHNWGQGVNTSNGWSSSYYYGNFQFEYSNDLLFFQYNKQLEHLYIHI